MSFVNKDGAFISKFTDNVLANKYCFLETSIHFTTSASIIVKSLYEYMFGFL